MNTDADQMLKKKKLTASILCLVAAALVLVSLFLPWLKAAKPLDAGMSLLSFEVCMGDRCESKSNLELAKIMKKDHEDSGSSRAAPGTSFAYFGLATLVVGLVGVLALGAAGGLGLKNKFIAQPVAITSVALVALCLALVLGCIFVAVKPGDGEFGRLLGVSWPFFVFGAGVVGGIAGAQMLGKAHGPPEYDPYADPTALS